VAKIIVLFNLKLGISSEIYEAWAKLTDLPMVRNLNSVPSFEIIKVQGMLGTNAPAPYQYVEVIEINDMDIFGKELAVDIMQKVAVEFQSFADNPIFMICHSIES
jgi:REDY-like protein HapK